MSEVRREGKGGGAKKRATRRNRNKDPRLTCGRVSAVGALSVV